jgi:hypothetical protein
MNCFCFIIAILFFTLSISALQTVYSTSQDLKPLLVKVNTSARLTDPNLRLELVASNVSRPTNIAFLDSGDILVLEKNTGLVKKIVNGTVNQNPLFDANVATFDTRGMVGIVFADEFERPDYNEMLIKVFDFEKHFGVNYL